ncbi:PREDICTED: tachykinin-like peptides receptor 99D [Diuraphis noxia]|uniref:tachykinin-like peptides receptor 99D n=1 Tax=Diuraphis noxia TaxID=143948 RepID=UPI00076377B7|nr:PREDICTED: tachykinin-like peptides receptor 99D [Diuraphis noxia]
MNGSDFGGVNSTDNGTDGVAWPDSNQFELPWWHQLAWTVLFVPMIMVATGGNLIVIWIVMTNKRMRNVTNYFLVNLSIADAMVSTLNVSVNFSYMLTSNWTFGTAYCKISQFVAVLSICASVFTLMAISIDRYVSDLENQSNAINRLRNELLYLKTKIMDLVDTDNDQSDNIEIDTPEMSLA